MGDWIQSQFRSATPNWKTYSSPNGGLSFESPFPMEWETKERITNGKGAQIILGKSQHNRSGFSIDVNYTSFINIKSDPFFLKNLEGIFKNNFQQWKDQAITCSGMPATIANYSLDEDGYLLHFSELMIANQNRYLSVTTTTTQNNLNFFNEWTKHIVDSIKIELKN